MFDYNDFDDFDDFDLSVYAINVEQWDTMTPEEQDEYIKVNNIKCIYSTGICGSLTKGFGKLYELGYWEYACKSI